MSKSTRTIYEVNRIEPIKTSNKVFYGSIMVIKYAKRISSDSMQTGINE